LQPPQIGISSYGGSARAGDRQPGRDRLARKVAAQTDVTASVCTGGLMVAGL
jgi:hypothetical protein